MHEVVLSCPGVVQPVYFPRYGALVMQYLCQSVPQPLEVPGYFSHHLWHFLVVWLRGGGRAYDGGTLYKGPPPLVFWHVQFVQ